MAWSDPELREFRELAERVCNERELEVLRLFAAGYGERRVGLVLDISRESVRHHRRRAEWKIRREAASQRGYDNNVIS